MKKIYSINPFDILSGKVAKSRIGTFWFKEAGDNMQVDGWPIFENLHREDDLPAAEYKGGNKEWWINGKKHRDNDLPASITAKGRKVWCDNGKWHRLSGPAVIFANGAKEWYIDGKSLTEKEFNEYVRNKPV